ncbi:thiamine diphosphokinase [Thiotrichales bacterium 19S9-12]|nr:thiamine diphosphokinase [Thiotrichales bacterium 19S9-11]MCF6812325.1 thiamine diphosphokinase [Thiotrichales bacterium 19S9-12]
MNQLLSAKVSNEAVVILDGEINLEFIAKELESHQDKLIVCADGAYLKLQTNPIILKHLNAVVGDFDSIGDHQVKSHIELIHDKDQETTDFDKVLQYLVKYDITEALVYGASGLSSDHFLGNLSTALSWKDRIQLEFRDRYGVFFFFDKEITLKDVKNHKISLIPFFEANKIYCEGLMYRLNGETLLFGKRIGTRNIAVEDEVTVRYTGGNLLIYIEDKDFDKGVLI